MMRRNVDCALLCFLAIGLISAAHSAPTGKNVALKKPVYGNVMNRPYITDGSVQLDAKGLYDSQPYWFIDLGAIYKLNTIQLHTRGNVREGYKKPFTLSVWHENTSPCDMILHYPWKPVKQSLILNGTRGMMEISLDTEAQYIIVMTERDDPLKLEETITVSELMAFGVKIKDAYVPDFLKDPKNVPNHFKDLRRKLVSGQKNFWVEQNKGEYIPDYEMKDVVLGWHDGRVNTMAVTRGEGRIIVTSGKTGMNHIVTAKDYEPIRKNIKSWLAEGQSEPKFKPVSDSPTKGAILLITRDNNFNVDRIQQLIESGENSVIFGFVHEKKTQDNASALLEKLKIARKTTNLGYAGRNILISDLVKSSEYIPVETVLEAIEKSWYYLATPNVGSTFKEEYVITPRFQQQLKKTLLRYEEYANYVTPCESNIKSIDDKTAAAMLNYNFLIHLQRTESFITLPGVTQHPGFIAPSIKPQNYTVTIKNKYVNNQYIPVGSWAKAGEAVRYKVINTSHSNLSDMYIRINIQRDNLRNLRQLKRWPIVMNLFKLQDEAVVPTPVGGLIAVALPPDSEITIELTNVYRYPWFDIRDPKTMKTWQTDCKTNSKLLVPFTLITGDKMISMIQTEGACSLKLNDLEWLVKYHDNIVKVIHNYRGTDYRKSRYEMLAIDVQIRIGWGHSGYPFMGHLQWGMGWRDIKTTKEGRYTLSPHEIGHNLQVGGMTLNGGGEETNLLYIPVIHKVILNLTNAFEFGHVTGLTRGTEVVFSNLWKGTEYVSLKFAYYIYLGHIFSPALVSNAMTAVIHSNVHTGDEVIKTNFWVKQLCLESEYDLVPFHNLFHVAMNDETKAVCGKFECFIPDDIATKRVPEVIARVIAESGKTCQRTNPRQVKYKNNIIKGFDEVDEPFLVFH